MEKRNFDGLKKTPTKTMENPIAEKALNDPQCSEDSLDVLINGLPGYFSANRNSWEPESSQYLHFGELTRLSSEQI